MVKISNGLDTMTVTKGAYEGIYKFQGYSLVHDYAMATVDKMQDIPTEVEDNSVDTVEAENDYVEPVISSNKVELLEKPIGQWSKEELKEFAVANDISLEGVKGTKEVREIIKKFIDEN